MIFLYLIFAAQVNAARIICVAPSACEWAAHILNQDPEKSEIVAVSDWSEEPEFLSKIVTIGPYTKLNLEKIISLKPSVIIASKDGNDPGQIDRLLRMGLSVHVMEHLNLESLGSEIEKLSIVLVQSKNSEAMKRWNAWQAKMALLKSSTNSKKVLIILSHNPIIAAGKSSFYTSALNYIGLKNALLDSAPLYPRLSRERITKLNPDWIIDVKMDFNGQKDEQNISLVGWKGQWIPLSSNSFSRVGYKFLDQLTELKLRASNH